jgi:IclR family acetate operon transcriptional repressor
MQTIERALNILEAVLNHKEEISISELAEKTKLNRATAHRISSTLVKRGYLQKSGRGGRLSIGLALIRYNDSANYTTTLRNVAFPLLTKLRDETSETVILSVLNGIEVVDIAVVSTKHLLRIFPETGSVVELYCSSVGKIFSAFVLYENIEPILMSRKLIALTDKTKIDINAIKRELEIIKQDEVAFDDEEYMIGMRSAASQVRDESGSVIASAAFLGPSSRINKQKMKQYAPMVKNCAMEISRALGYKGV